MEKELTFTIGKGKDEMTQTSKRTQTIIQQDAKKAADLARFIGEKVTLNVMVMYRFRFEVTGTLGQSNFDTTVYHVYPADSRIAGAGFTLASVQHLDVTGRIHLKAGD